MTSITNNHGQLLKMFKPNDAGESIMPDASKIIAGHPLQHLWIQYMNADGSYLVGEWTCEPGAWTVRYGANENEFCHIHEGQVRLTQDNGTTTDFVAGDRMVIPPGFVGVWECVTFTRKTFVLFDPQLPL